MTRPNGVTVYEGPSAIDGAPIMAVVTGIRAPSQNVKTGPMMQLWITRQDQLPTDAKRDGTDTAICGECPIKKACYVNVGQAPQGVWKAWAAGRYDSGIMPTGSQLRLGAYGDPMALPLHVVEGLVARATDHSGYTHQWRAMRHWYGPWNHWQRIIMASVETEDDALEAQSLGWRTFRVKRSTDRRLPGEMPCPAGPKRSRVQCHNCPIKCHGGEGPNIVIDVHGSTANHF